MAQATTAAWRREMEELLARARALLLTGSPDQFWLEHVEEVIAAFMQDLIVTDGMPKGVSVSKDLQWLAGDMSFFGRGGSRHNHKFYAGWAAAKAQYALALGRPTPKQRQSWLKSVRADLDLLTQDPDPADSTLQSNRARKRAGYLAPHKRLLQAALEHYPDLRSDKILQELIEDVPDEIREALEPVELATDGGAVETDENDRIHFRFMTGAAPHSCSRRTALNILSELRKERQKPRRSRKAGKP